MKKLQLLSIVFFSLFLFSFECNTKMTKSELLVHQGVRAVLPADFEYDFKFKVLSYDWVYKSRNDTYSGSSKSAKYPDELVRHIKDGNPKDILLIENVKVIGDDKFIRKISGMTVVLI